MSNFKEEETSELTRHMNRRDSLRLVRVSSILNYKFIERSEARFSVLGSAHFGLLEKMENVIIDNKFLIMF